jgi:spermidine synthase
MGGTIPILTQALARNLTDATRVHALIYACNTVGAFAGTLASGFVFVHWLGLQGTLIAMGLGNVAIGAAFVWLGRRPRALADLDVGETADLRADVFAVYGGIALLVGFAMMVLQTTVIRMGGLSFGSSEYTFTMVVAVFVLCIALGSFAVSAFSRIGRFALPATLWILALLFAALYFALEVSPYWAHRLRIVFRDLDIAFYPFYSAVFLAFLAAIGPAVVFSGAVLPLLFHALRREVGDLGSQAGRLYSVNTVGSLLGALIGGYALLFWLDLHHVYRIAVAALALAATIATLQQFPRIRFAGAAVLLIASLVAIQQLPGWNIAYLMGGTFRSRGPTEWTFAGPEALTHGAAFKFYDDDPNTSVGVQEFGNGKTLTRSIIVNGKSDGNTKGDYLTMAMTGLVPALFADQPRHAFVVGFGTGVTAGELAVLDEIETVTVAEISAGVIKASPLFDFANHGVSHHPKITFVRSDAYRALLKRRDSYDLIISEPSNPWVTGIEQLYSREFLEEARDRLAPGGVYGQWFHVYETSSKTVELIVKTYASVFDHVAIWSANYADLLLVGVRDADAALDLPRLQRRFQRPDFRAGFARAGIRDFPQLLAHETMPLGVANVTALAGPIHSLYHPQLSYEAGRGFFVGRRGMLPFTGYGEPVEVGAANSLLLRFLASVSPESVGRVREGAALHACREQLPNCGALAAAWLREQPGSETARRLAQRLSQQFGPAFVSRLALLFDVESQPTNRVRPAAAVEMTELFLTHYSHAAPFSANALLGIWERCGLDARGMSICEPGRRTAERLVIGDAPPPADEWLTAVPESTRVPHLAPPAEEAETAEEDDAVEEP